MEPRFHAKCAAHGLHFAPWIVVLSAAVQIGCAVVAVWQRDALWPLGPIALAPLLVVAAHAAQWFGRVWIPWWVLTAACLIAATWIFSEPVVIGNVDLLIGLLAVMIADVTVTDGVRAGIPATVATLLLVTWHWNGEWVGVGEIVFGLAIGGMLRSQSRALVAERTARRHAAEQATLAERQRVARDIHDLVGHSLSVTMLHVTASRRALDDAAEHPETQAESVAEARAALVDAERIGREAMSEIRRTVSVLASESAGSQALPGAADLPHLVEQCRAAGVSVQWRVDGDLAHVPTATGLALYRVMQECLANAVRHAPGAPVCASITVDAHSAALSCGNPLPPGVASGRAAGPGGNGLPGFRTRAEQAGGTVTAGPVGSRWEVRFTVPIATGPTPMAREPKGPSCTLLQRPTEARPEPV